MQDYTAYGLRLRSAIALPFTPLPDGLAGEPDVVIRLGATPASLPTAHGKPGRWQTMPGRFLLNVDDVARYFVADGRDVVIERRGGSDHDISVYLTGSVLAAVLQQRDVATLHASAVQTNAGAVLFLGKSGAGKSSLLAALIKRLAAARWLMRYALSAGVQAPSVLPPQVCWRQPKAEPARTDALYRSFTEAFLLIRQEIAASPPPSRARYIDVQRLWECLDLSRFEGGRIPFLEISNAASFLDFQQRGR